jgi:Family of unknown function (DUF6236)
MSGSAAIPGFRRHGLYYPYFHVRDERWIRVAALYWPKIVRIVPDQYRTRDSRTVRALADDFIIRQPPGKSVDAVAPRFSELIANHADELRARFDATSPPRPGMISREATLGPGPEWALTAEGLTEAERPPRDLQYEWDYGHGRWLTGVHLSEIAPQLRTMLMDTQLAVLGRRSSEGEGEGWVNAVDGQVMEDPYNHPHRVWHRRIPESELHAWLLMHPALVGVYTSVLAEDFAAANMLQPTTDQESAYLVTNDWTADRIAAALLGDPGPSASLRSEELPEALGFLALGLVIPANLGEVPIDQIIKIRERYSAEFFAFREAVDQAVASIATLTDIRDKEILEDYLNQVVTVRFAEPLNDLRRILRRLTGDTVTVSINVKTQLPASAALAGGAWLSGHPLLAGTSAIALGLMAVRRGIREKKEDALKSAPAASYLLHTGTQLQPRNLLNRTFSQLARIAGTSIP